MSTQVANKSKRSFIVSGGKKILPGTVASLPEDEAKRLLALYPDELFEEGVTLEAVAVKAPEAPVIETPAPAADNTDELFDEGVTLEAVAVKAPEAPVIETPAPAADNTDETPKRRGRPSKA